MGDSIKKIWKILLFSLILFICIGIASANENNTDTDDIKELIDECEDNGTVKLEEKTYYLNPENDTRISLNKSISIEGTNRTVIDGKNKTLILDVMDENASGSQETPVPVLIDDLIVKNTGKHITFKNITFKDLNMISLHEMEFIDCIFIKTDFTSKEMNNTFKHCIFNQSKVELSLYDIGSYSYHSKIINCTLHSTLITSKERIFVDVVGSSRYFIKNRISIMDSNVSCSNITFNYNNITISNTKLENSKLKGSSDIASISNAAFNNAEIDFDYSDINFEKSDLDNATLEFEAGYYTKGCDISLKNITMKNSALKISPNIKSKQSSLTIQNTSTYKCEIKPTDTNVRIDYSKLNKTLLELSFSNLNVTNSTFHNDGDLKNTIKTRTEKEIYCLKNGTFTLENVTCPMNTTYNVENSYFINNTGKHKINNQDININIYYEIFYDKSIE